MEQQPLKTMEAVHENIALGDVYELINSSLPGHAHNCTAIFLVTDGNLITLARSSLVLNHLYQVTTAHIILHLP